jgi:hypothetical protein
MTEREIPVVEDFTPETKILAHPGQPTLLCRRRVTLPSCRCAVWIGIRADNQEAATAAVSCSDLHVGLMTTFNESMVKSLENPTNRDLVDVVQELLGEARAQVSSHA